MSAVSIILEENEAVVDNIIQQEEGENLEDFEEEFADDIPPVKSSDDEYDTDIEIADVKDEYDATGKKAYYNACKRLNTTPVSYFIKNMGETEINLQYHGVGIKGAKAIAAALVANTVTLKINLTENYIGYEGTRAIGEMLKENCYINDLNLSSNYLGPDGCRCICEMLQQNLNLKKLDLSRNKFGDSVGSFLADAFKNNFKLVSLDLSENGLSEKSGVALGPGVNANDAMEYLNLSWNQFNHKSIIEIAHGLRANCTLKVLDLSWNGFTSLGAIALADALKANNTLIELNICNNRIGFDGAIGLAKGLDGNNTLEILKLDENPVTEKGAMAILNSTSNKSDSAMRQLHLKGVFVTDDFAQLYKHVKEAKDVTVYANFRYLTPLEKIQQFISIANNKEQWLTAFEEVDEQTILRVTASEFFDVLQKLGFELNYEEQIALLGKIKKDSHGRVKYKDTLLGFAKDPPPLDQQPLGA